MADPDRHDKRPGRRACRQPSAATSASRTAGAGDPDGVGVSTPARHRIVVLLGTNYSGSHLLSHLLSAHPDCLGVGEIHRFHQLLDTGIDAAVVSEYRTDPLFEGLADQSVLTWHATLLTRFAERSKVADPVVVDNSKRVEWVRRIARNRNYHIHCVHLIRDPRALVFRWLHTYTTPRTRRRQRLRAAKRLPGRGLRILCGPEAQVYVYKWLRMNREISRYLARSGLPWTVVTYHDMVFDTEHMLTRLMPVLGLTFHPEQLRFGQGSFYGTRKTAHVDAVERSEIRPDVKWRSEFPPASVALVERNADVQAYIGSLGLELTPNGLTRVAAEGEGTC